MKNQKINKIKFAGDYAEDLTYSPLRFKDTFYQFCQIKNPDTDLYSTRKVIFNERYEIINAFEKEYNINMIKKFTRSTNPNKYKIFPTNDIKNVAYPNGADFMQAKSEMINGNGFGKETKIYGGYMADFGYGAECTGMEKKRRTANDDKNMYNIGPNKKQLDQINNNTVTAVDF